MAGVGGAHGSGVRWSASVSSTATGFGIGGRICIRSIWSCFHRASADSPIPCLETSSRAMAVSSLSGFIEDQRGVAQQIKARLDNFWVTDRDLDIFVKLLFEPGLSPHRIGAFFKYVVNNWQLSSITTLATGHPGGRESVRVTSSATQVRFLPAR